MTDVPATYFDGRTSQPRAVTLRWHAFDSVLEVHGENLTLRIPRREVTVESRLGRGPRFVRFADGGRCEVADHAGLDAVIATWAPDRAGSWLHRIETSWTLVAVSVVLLIAVGWATIQFGLPWGARRVAFMLPANLTRVLSDQTLATLDRTMFQPSQLTHERQLQLQSAFKDFLAKVGDATTYQIEFRRSSDGLPNAFALPSGAIVLTDELIQLAADDREVIGVLAHECGHVRERHALRAVLQNSAVFVVIALVTGDISSSTAFGGALPAFLLQNRFSRAFEREADDHAIVQLRAAGIAPGYLADMLQSLDRRHGAHDSEFLGYLRSHPPTPERIQRIRGANAAPRD